MLFPFAVVENIADVVDSLRAILITLVTMTTFITDFWNRINIAA